MLPVARPWAPPTSSANFPSTYTHKSSSPENLNTVSSTISGRFVISLSSLNAYTFITASSTYDLYPTDTLLISVVSLSFNKMYPSLLLSRLTTFSSVNLLNPGYVIVAFPFVNQ